MISDLKYTHAEGHCVLRYTPPGSGSSRVFTGGADGEVRSFRSLEDEEKTSYLIGDETLGLAVGSKSFYASGSKMNTASAFGLEDGAKEGVVLRCSADVTTLDWGMNEDKELLAGGSEDMTVKVVDLESKEISTFKGHEASVLSVALEPKNLDKLVSTSCDGSIILWSIPDVKILKIHNAVLPTFSDFEGAVSLSQVKWSPIGDPTFAVAHQHALVFYHGMNGSEIKRFSIESTDKEEYLSVLDWFSNGKYIVGGTSKGKILLWSCDDGVLHYNNNPGRSNGIRSIAWCPGKLDEISFLNKEAYWGTLAVDLEDEGSEKGLLDEDEMVKVFDEEEDDEDNSFSIKKIKAASGFEETPDGEDVFRPLDIESKVAHILNKDEEDTPSERIPRPPSPVIEVQEAFQPGSTPSHLSSRFMVWNSLGIVKSTRSEEENAIDVDFHDSALHHAFHLPNNQGYSMACLSDRALALASEADDLEDESSSSKLMVHYFASSDAHKEWSVNMPKGEEILCIAIGSSWVAAATDKRNLRLFSLGGTQRGVFSLCGPVLTLSGHEDTLLIVSHFSSPLPHNQSPFITILDVSGHSQRHLIPHPTPLPLTPSSQLSWAGFSDEGTPVTSDSVGIVRLLNPVSKQWAQVCDMSSYAKGKSENHFMLGLSESEELIRAIKCKGTASYPVTVPLPTVSVLSLQLPLCEAGSEKSSLEERFLKGLFLQKGEIDSGETVLKLFALAIKTDAESRAMEIARLMTLDTLKIALKYASKLRKMQLANKLNGLARELSEQEAQREEEEASQRDMFESHEEDPEDEDISPQVPADNPLLKAKMKRKEGGGLIKCIEDSQSQGETRNPFKKAVKGSPAGSIRSGSVFDSLSQGSIKSSQDAGGSSFSPFEKRKVTEKQGLITLSSLMKKNKKENKPGGGGTDDAASSGKHLKGFLLWLAENPQDAQDSGRNKELGLKIWKDFSKDEKDKYKTPRAAAAAAAASPLSNHHTNRKRRTLEDPKSSEDAPKKPKSLSLSAFAAPE
eukprot:TRINITY_DN3759_c0_g2_i1.p1 TRINITY_DN3759_c0_g2~~TRINITY_DN3759_c0_g2_i1.p1  ORF type:complete len:1018 (+),score=314.13 TRINITY_DN3759_c0_g2_i1:37-3090(+)